MLKNYYVEDKKGGGIQKLEAEQTSMRYKDKPGVNFTWNRKERVYRRKYYTVVTRTCNSY